MIANRKLLIPGEPIKAVVRSIILLLSLAIPALAAAQSPWDQQCFRYQPAASEVAEILKMAKAKIPPDAELETACSYNVPAIHGPAEIVMNKTRVYWLIWPTDKAYRYVRIMQKGQCSRAYDDVVSCETSPKLIAKGSSSETIELYDINSPVEIYDLLEFRDRFLGAGYIISEMHQTNILHKNPPKIDENDYEIYGSGGGYDVVKRCDTFAKCTWKLSGPFSRQY